MTNQNLKPTKRMTIYLSREEAKAIKQVALNKEINLNTFLREAVKRAVEANGGKWETYEVKK